MDRAQQGLPPISTLLSQDYSGRTALSGIGNQDSPFQITHPFLSSTLLSQDSFFPVLSSQPGLHSLPQPEFRLPRISGQDSPLLVLYSQDSRFQYSPQPFTPSKTLLEQATSLPVPSLARFPPFQIHPQPGLLPSKTLFSCLLPFETLLSCLLPSRHRFGKEFSLPLLSFAGIHSKNFLR